MWKNIKVFLIGFITAIFSILLFIVSGGKGNSENSGQSDLDKNNTRIRQGNDSLRKLNDRARERNKAERKSIKLERDSIKRERERAKREREIINDTRKSVSGIIKNSRKSKSNN